MPLRFAPARGAGALVLNSLVRGPTGAAATVTVGTTTTLAAGNSATTANSGSTAAAVLDFGIPRGADAGIKWLYDSSTSMADPGTGDIRFNNATLSSVTAIALSATGSGSDVSDYVATWDDSGSAVKGYLIIREEAGSEAAIFSVSAVTDNTAWLQLTVAYVAGSLTLTAADPLYLNHYRTGDPGAIGGSTGATDNAVLRADGVGGATLQNSSVTIDDSGNIASVTSITIANTGLHIFDTNASHDLIIVPGSDLTADRNLTLTTGDAARTVTISGNATISQDYSTTGNPQFATIELGAATDTTISRSSAGVIAVEGVTVSLNSTSATHTAGTIELGAATDTTLSRSAAGVLAVEGAIVKMVGVETVYVPSSAMISRTTNGAASGSVETTTNKVMLKTLDFDTSTQEFSQFSIRMPKSWNESTVTARFTWSHASTVTNFGVVWALEGIALSDDDAGDTAFGTAQQIADTGGTTNDVYITSATPAITIGGTPAAEDWVVFQVKRVPADASDTLGVDARLHGVTLYITTDAANDA